MTAAKRQRLELSEDRTVSWYPNYFSDEEGGRVAIREGSLIQCGKRVMSEQVEEVWNGRTFAEIYESSNKESPPPLPPRFDFETVRSVRILALALRADACFSPKVQ